MLPSCVCCVKVANMRARSGARNEALVDDVVGQTLEIETNLKNR